MTFDQLLWEYPNTILSVCFSDIYKVDLRIGKVVIKWNALKNYTEARSLTCMVSDNQYAIMTETNDNKIILWDQRKGEPIQTYTVSNPYVCVVQYDSSKMYSLTNNVYVHEFNFAYNNIVNIPT